MSDHPSPTLGGTGRVRVLLVDDHPVLRAGLRVLLDLEEDLEVVGEATSGEEAIGLVRELRPAVVVMDLSMPGMNGLEATRRIRELGLGTGILILTVHAEEEYLLPVVEAGGNGYLTKTSADRDLVEAVRTVARGQVFLPDRASALLLRAVRNREEAVGGSLESLSPREREVLGLTAEGFSSTEIGERLAISSKTVDTYRGRVMEKLGLNHRSELVRFALRAGLLAEL